MTFDQKEYIKDWQSKNMKTITVRFNTEYIESFKQSCKLLDISQREVFKKAMDETNAKAKKLK